MNGASREALAAGREQLDALTDNTSVDAAKLGDELAAVTTLLDREVSLRRVLTDPAQAEANRTLEEYKAQLAEARHEAARITEQAREQGATIIAEMREEGQRQRDAIVAAGHAQIEADRRQVTVTLRQEVGRIATDLAGKLVGESLEDHARQSRVVDRFLTELEEADAGQVRERARSGAGAAAGAATDGGGQGA
jgi:F0F1-type ATP synthase membrane subunit b/b'